jgi:helicase MOV-10
LKQTYIGCYEDRLEMFFQDLQSKKKFFISRALRVVIGNKEDHEQLKASKSYVPRSQATVPKKAERKIIQGIKPPALTSIPYVKKLKPELIPKKLQDAVSDGSTAEIIKKIRSGFLPPTLNSHSLARHFKALLWVEEHRAQYVELFFSPFPEF